MGRDEQTKRNKQESKTKKRIKTSRFRSNTI
jgi:hypothetical protein